MSARHVNVVFVTCARDAKGKVGFAAVSTVSILTVAKDCVDTPLTSLKISSCLAHIHFLCSNKLTTFSNPCTKIGKDANSHLWLARMIDALAVKKNLTYDLDPVLVCTKGKKRHMKRLMKRKSFNTISCWVSQDAVYVLSLQGGLRMVYGFRSWIMLSIKNFENFISIFEGRS